MAPFRFIAHIGLFTICVYVFCFASPLLGSNWTNWLWAIATMTPMLLCHAFLIADEGDDDIEYPFKCIVCCVDSACIASILIKIFAQIPEIHSIVFLIVLLFVMEIGPNRMTLSHLFGWASLFMVWPYANFHSWKEIVAFVFLCLVVAGLIISSSIYQYNQEEEKDDDTRIGTSIANFVLVTIIISVCLFFINYRDPIMEQLPNRGYLYLAYCILGLVIGFTNNIASILFAVAAGVCYFTLLSSWGISIDWCLHGITSCWDWVSSFFITLWHWIAWGVIHIWDGIVWLALGLWRCVVWVVTNIWGGIVWIASAIWWLFFKSWFWIAFLALIVIFLVIMLINKDGNSSRNITHRPKPIIYRGRYMTCPSCRETLVKGEPTNRTTRGTIKTATKATVGVSVTGCATIGATIGSAIPGAGTLVGGIIGGGVGLLAGAWASYKINSKVDSGTEKVIDKISYLADGVELHFHCPFCGYEWNRVEMDGKIVH